MKTTFDKGYPQDLIDYLRFIESKWKGFRANDRLYVAIESFWQGNRWDSSP